MSQALRNSLIGLLGERVRFDEPLSRHTTWRVGGPAWALAEVHSVEEASTLAGLVREARLPLKPLGRGSNLLFSDRGYRGVLLKLGGELAKLEQYSCGLRAGGGASLAAAVKLATQAGLSGLEWAVGIPASIGGAISGNAGALGGDMAGLTHFLTLLEAEGRTVQCQADQLPSGYRWFGLPAGSIVLGANLVMQPSDPEKVERLTQENLTKRRTTQPLHRATCGSVFKNPEGDFAGRLIEDCGLKGFKLGGAMVSQIHANFIENTGNAKAVDIKLLMLHVARVVATKHGIHLEPEVEEVAYA